MPLAGNEISSSAAAVEPFSNIIHDVWFKALVVLLKKSGSASHGILYTSLIYQVIHCILPYIKLIYMSERRIKIHYSSNVTMLEKTSMTNVRIIF